MNDTPMEMLHDRIIIVTITRYLLEIMECQ